MDEGVMRAERLVGEVLAPRSGAADRRAEAAAAVEALLQRSADGDPAAIDAVRRMAVRRDVVTALPIPIRSYVSVIPDGWVDHVIQIQGLEPEDLLDLAGAPRLFQRRPSFLAAALDLCTNSRHASVAAQVLGEDALPLESVGSLLADGRRCRALSLDPATIVLRLRDDRGARLVDERWSAEQLEALGRADPGPSVSGAVNEVLVRKALDRSDVDAIVRAGAFGGLDGRRRSTAAAASIVEGQFWSAIGDLGSTNRRRQVAAVAAIGHTDRLLGHLDGIDEVPPADLARAKEAAIAARQALQKARPGLLRAAVTEAIGRGPGSDFLGWRREVEHLARCADVLVAGDDPGSDMARLAAEARIAIVTASARPPHRIWMLGPGAAQVCAWCGAWVGADWRHCGGCGAARSF